MKPLLSGLRASSFKPDVVILAEFSIHYAAFSWLLARLTGALHVVDFFVGNYETKVEDWAWYRPWSVRGLLQKAIDRFALWTADIVLTDTAPRKRRLESIVRNTAVLELPVGAPRWAHVRKQRSLPLAVPLKILYYGNYLPLHGIPRLLMAVARLSSGTPVELTLVGSGLLRSDIELLAEDLGLFEVTTFLDAVEVEALVGLMDSVHVVAGIFGSSTKAREVVANKVWQGLAAGCYVVTQDSEALSDLKRVSRNRLVTVIPGSVSSIVEAFERISRELALSDQSPSIGPALDSLLEEAYKSAFSCPALRDPLTDR